METNRIINSKQIKLISFDVSEPVQIEAKSSALVLNNIDIRALSISPAIPSNAKITGLWYLWSSGSACIPLDIMIWSNYNVSMRLYNISNNMTTITKLRMLIAYE